MAIDPFFKRPTTPDEWRARARIIESQLEGLTIAELLRGTDKHGQPIGGSGSGEYDPNQPRVPAGHSDGGQWTDKPSGGPINDPRVISDAIPDNEWIPGADYAAGHHWYARHFYQNHQFSREVKSIFRNATSGPLIRRLYSQRRQKWLSHGYGYDDPHRQYDRAVDELATKYMRDRGISAQQMTPDQANEVLDLIKKSPDPRIGPYVRMINTLHRFFRRFGPRGNE